MIGRVLVFAGAAAASFALPALAASEPRPPTGKWVVDFANSMCVLQREYGTAEARVVLAFRPEPMGERMTIYVLDRPVAQSPQYVPVKIGFGPGSAPVEAQMASFNLSSRAFRLNETGVKREELERAVESGTVSFVAGKRMNSEYALPGFGNALKVLDECVADLLDTWGFNRERQKAVGKLAELKKPMAEYVSGNHYPTEALRAGEMGGNSARYRIDAQGNVSDCVIVESSKSQSLDRTLCRVVRRFHFTPALDKAGQPMESIGFTRIRWMLG